MNGGVQDNFGNRGMFLHNGLKLVCYKVLAGCEPDSCLILFMFNLQYVPRVNIFGLLAITPLATEYLERALLNLKKVTGPESLYIYSKKTTNKHYIITTVTVITIIVNNRSRCLDAERKKIEAS